MSRTRVFCVTGMHRSGTSAVSRVANLLGASLGSEDELLGALPQNERGFWENTRLKEINEDVLAFMGGSWDRPPDLRRGWESSEGLEDLRHRGLSALAELSAGAELFLWKDPRTSLTLPFWQSIAHIDGTLLALRHPAAVVSSLAVRNDMDREVGAALWLRYTASAFVSDPHAHVVRFDELVEDTSTVVDAMATFLGVDRPTHTQLVAIDEFLAPELRHHEAVAGVCGPVERLAIETYEVIAETGYDSVGSLLEVVDTSGLALVGALPQTAARQEAEAKLEEFKARLEASQGRSRELKDELEASKEKVRGLRESLESSKVRARTLKQDFEKQLEAAKSSNRDLKASLQSVTKAHSAMEEEVAESQGRIMRLEYQLEDKKRLEAELSRTRTQYARLRNRRIVRLGLAMANLARPLFRFRRGQFRSPATSTAGRKGVSSQGDRKRERKAGGQSGADEGTVARRAEAVGSQKETVPKAPPTELLRVRPTVSIVIPVHGALDELRKCVSSVLRNTFGDCELLIIDDASPEPDVKSYLNDLESSHSRVRVMVNDENLGFVRTVNRGFESTDGDVVILNSDTQVPPGWVGSLQRVAYSDPTIGTVTPLSNNAGAFSAPIRGAANEMPLGIDAMGRLVARHSERLIPEAPSGHGFCMYFKRELLEATGGFDAESFPRGYGEENDISMRASRLGWRHVIDDSTIVFHVRSASFKEEKAELLARGRAKLDELHPDYGDRVKEFLKDPVMQRARENVGRAVTAAQTGASGLPRVLYVMHSGRGGTPKTNEDLMAGVSDRYEPLLLISDGRSVTLHDGQSGSSIEQHRFSDRIEPGQFTSPEYRGVMADMLERHDIELIHIRHLQRHTFDLPDVARLYDIPVILSFHDFYYICPSVHLLDEKDTYCGGVCTPGQGICHTPSWFKGVPHLKHGWVRVWQEKVQEMFASVDAFVTTSRSAADVYRRVFPQMDERRLEIIEHGRNLTQEGSLARFPESGEPAKVLLLGHIGVHKGARLVSDVQTLDVEGKLAFHLLGTVTKDVDLEIVDHGQYDREQVQSLIRDIQPAVIALLSIWPETYSHTLTEAWSLGIPVVASDLGALRDRVEDHGGGWLVDVSDPAEVYRTLVEVVSNRSTWEEQRSMASIVGLPGVDDMARRYVDLYAEVRDRHRPLATGARA